MTGRAKKTARNRGSEICLAHGSERSEDGPAPPLDRTLPYYVSFSEGRRGKELYKHGGKETSSGEKKHSQGLIGEKRHDSFGKKRGTG